MKIKINLKQCIVIINFVFLNKDNDAHLLDFSIKKFGKKDLKK
jgi:hypothetical protein